MKKNVLFLLMVAVMGASCSTESISDDFINNGQNGWQQMGGSGNSGTNTDLDFLTIDIDTTPLTESEVIPSTDKDYVENFVPTNTIYINYSGNSANYTGTVEGVSVAISGADVVVTSTVEDVNYVLSGATSDGSFKMAKSGNNKKFILTLNGVSIKNEDGPAVNVQVGKRCYVVAKEGTNNYLSDGTSYADSDEDQKGTIFSEGELLFSGKGVINISANTKAGIASDDYIMIRPNTNIYVNASAGNGIKGKDGIDIRGGVVNIEVSARASKGISTDGYYKQSGGRVTAITTGDAIYDSDKKDVSGSSGLKADSVIVIDGGELLLKSTGAGGKGMSGDKDITINGGTVKVITTGKTYTYSSDLDSKSKGIKADGNLTISGGNIFVKATGDSGSEGIESKAKMNITGGTTMVYSYDDAMNSADDMTISGGYIYAHATNNDGLDANGNLYIKGGLVYAVGASSPELAIDANTEEGKKLYITGGTIVALGGLERGSSLTQNCYYTSSWTSNTWYALKYGDKIFAFKTPGSGGSTLVVSAAETPTLTQGVNISDGTELFNSIGFINPSLNGGSSVTLSTYTGNTGMPGGRW